MDDVFVLNSAQSLYDSGCIEDSYLLIETILSKKNISIMEQALFLAGKICEGKNEFRLAIDFYSKAIRLINKYSLDDINYRMAYCYAKLKCFKEAEETVIH